MRIELEMREHLVLCTDADPCTSETVAVFRIALFRT